MRGKSESETWETVYNESTERKYFNRTTRFLEQDENSEQLRVNKKSYQKIARKPKITELANNNQGIISKYFQRWGVGSWNRSQKKVGDAFCILGNQMAYIDLRLVYETGPKRQYSGWADSDRTVAPETKRFYNILRAG